MQIVQVTDEITGNTTMLHEEGYNKINNYYGLRFDYYVSLTTYYIKASTIRETFAEKNSQKCF